MGGFSGFTEVGRRLQAGHRGRMVNLAVQVERYEFLVAREFATGRDLASVADMARTRCSCCLAAP